MGGILCCGEFSYCSSRLEAKLQLLKPVLLVDEIVNLDFSSSIYQAFVSFIASISLCCPINFNVSIII